MKSGYNENKKRFRDLVRIRKIVINILLFGWLKYLVHQIHYSASQFTVK